jgi:hypothetical protein
MATPVVYKLMQPFVKRKNESEEKITAIYWLIKTTSKGKPGIAPSAN